ncbi:MAG: tRNA guanosine(34) transglycosylase Tgt [Anaerolineales bacterium]|nr:tRNA guanosine(34) transglycosylase Tgt [Anaerolineales bacterium]
MKPNYFSFNLQSIDGLARAGVFHTPHGDIETPVFAPVGTQATVKSITPAQLEELGATLVLSNTYHLYLRPGDDLIKELGGLHNFMNWSGPILTDSGGFQVYSLASSRQVDEDGVTFKSHIDGSLHRLTPEKAIAIQENLGADIIMAFDECAEPYNQNYIGKSLARTHNWAERCLRVKTRDDQALFGIIQGGVFPELRYQSAQYISSLGFDGHAIGGLSVGETKDEMFSVLDHLATALPPEKPRYLMGVGTPEDLVNCIVRGIDIFDSVFPTRLARHNTAIISNGKRLNMMNASYARDKLPLEESCSCYTCMNFSRAYLRHLILSKEMLSATLLSIHNLHALIQITKDIRNSILSGQVLEFVTSFNNSL